MYTVKNFRTKKELKEALKKERVMCFQPGPFGTNPTDGTVYLEGHITQNHIVGMLSGC